MAFVSLLVTFVAPENFSKEINSKLYSILQLCTVRAGRSGSFRFLFFILSLSCSTLSLSLRVPMLLGLQSSQFCITNKHKYVIPKENGTYQFCCFFSILFSTWSTFLFSICSVIIYFRFFSFLSTYSMFLCVINRWMDGNAEPCSMRYFAISGIQFCSLLNMNAQKFRIFFCSLLPIFQMKLFTWIITNSRCDEIFHPFLRHFLRKPMPLWLWSCASNLWMHLRLSLVYCSVLFQLILKLHTEIIEIAPKNDPLIAEAEINFQKKNWWFYVVKYSPRNKNSIKFLHSQ